MGYLKPVLVLCLVFEVLVPSNGAAFEQAIEPEQNAPVSTFTCTAPSIQTSYSSNSDFNDQALAWHNYLRCTHGAPAMALNETLRSAAQTWTEYMANNDDFDHDGSRGSVGENIAVSSSTYDNGAYRFVHGKYGTWEYNGAPVGYKWTWYCGEEERYNYDTDASDGGVVGHFTQIVWKSSTQLGCGVAQGTWTSPSGTAYPGATYVACRYYPAGNFPGKYGSNVNDYASGYNYASVCPSS